MPSLYAYQKSIDAVTTHYLKLPETNMAEQAGQEIATLPDGRTVVVLYDGFTLPESQPAAIADSIELLSNPLPNDLRDAIKLASPHVALINSRTEGMIREKYSMSDEAKFARIGVGASLGAYVFEPGEQEELLAFGAYCEAARAWGRVEKAKLGL